MRPMLRISLFGQFSVLCSDEVLLARVPHRVRSLFAYLVLNRERAPGRDAIASALWPSVPAAEARSHLRHTLWHLRHSLEQSRHKVASRALHHDSRSARLVFDEHSLCDVIELERAYTAMRGAGAGALSRSQIAHASAAAHLYTGDLLAAWEEEWCLPDRERLRRTFITLAQKLVDASEARAEAETVIAVASLALRHDGTQERICRSLMRALSDMGDRASALRHFERCVAALRELHVKPEPETLELARRIRRGPTRPPRRGARSSES